ncbi:MAG TPA: glycerol-3-phosphate 1-O-acyltransferase PlsY [Gemmatimonadales bacterium]|jgi:glycerol-3-phosphate acyltransferase PlsY
MTMTWGIAAAASYFLGAIPTSYLVARAARGLDLRMVGSGNLGATNLYRMLGWKYAFPVALFDACKGAIPVAVFGPWIHAGMVGSLVLGFIAVIGHVFSVFVRFRGGKGVATSAGVVFGLAPAAFAAALAIWGATLALSGYVSLASIIAAAILPAAIWFLDPMRRGLAGWFAALAVLVIWMHRGNIRRLLNGTENRFGRAEPLARGTQ